MSGLAKRFMLGAAMFWLVIGQVGSAQAGPIAYVVAHDYTTSSPDLFGQVNLTTGNFTLISDLNTPGYTIFGMGFGANGQIYGVGYNFASPGSPGELYGINPTTGAATDLGSVPFTPVGAGSGANGTLYALDIGAPSASLYSINPPSNSSTFINTVTFTSDGLVAIDSKGNLFAAGNGDGSFYEVNTSNASSTLIGNTGLGDTLYAGAFVGNTLYGFSGSSPNGVNITTIVTIDTSNASITTGANINFNAPNNQYQVVAAAASTVVPEPSSLVLGLIGGLGVLACGLLRRPMSNDSGQQN